jgi:hypothetical protein
VARNQGTSKEKERRRRLRFPLNVELRYVAIGKGTAVNGTGRVQDISSSAMAFHSDKTLHLRLRLRISMAWPAKLGNETKLRLVFEGVVLRTVGTLVVVTISRPHFRTAGREGSVTSR